MNLTKLKLNQQAEAKLEMFNKAVYGGDVDVLMQLQFDWNMITKEQYEDYLKIKKDCLEYDEQQ